MSEPTQAEFESVMLTAALFAAAGQEWRDRERRRQPVGDPDLTMVQTSEAEHYVQLHGTWYRVPGSPEVYVAAPDTPPPYRDDVVTRTRASLIIGDWLARNHPKEDR